MIQKKTFGYLDNKEVILFTLINKNGMKVELINYGASVKSIFVKDKSGNFEDIVLGYDTLNEYINDQFYFGSTIGRIAGRIANAEFNLDGKKYLLKSNDGKNHLHGGSKGFGKVVWDADLIDHDPLSSVIFNYNSVDGEEGYPGTLKISASYSLTDENDLIINYHATTDKSTIINTTNHSYFNLSGKLSESITDHQIFINADSFIVVDKTLIPTGKINSVENTPFDFRTAKPIGLRINDENNQLVIAGGYDHTFVINDFVKGKLRKAVEVKELNSGRTVTVFTDQPGVQFYTGNFLINSIKGKNDITYNYRSAFCLETQQFPDSINQPTFPSVVLNPDEVYEQKTIYHFDLIKD
jgi:aldose 1-epimerase